MEAVILFIAATYAALAYSSPGPTSESLSAAKLPIQELYVSAHCRTPDFEYQTTRIRDSETYSASWKAITAGQFPEPALPAVDFSKHHVVLIEMGQRQSGGYGLALAPTQASLRDGKVQIPLRELVPARGALLAQLIVSPCILVAVDASVPQVEARFRRDTDGE